MTSQRYLVLVIMLGVAAWGVFHAVGAYRYNHDPLRAVVVLVCVAGFLGFWGLMLAVRQRRLNSAPRRPHERD